MLGGDELSIDPQENEVSAYSVFRRSAAAGRKLKSGDILEAEDIIWVRPGTGVALGEEVNLVGKRVTRDINYAELLEPNDFKPQLPE